ncbi:sugar phosphate nucleotidyltransferase [Haemophilus influenzae]
MKSGDLNKYDLVKNTLVLVLAGGRGSRLHELTDKLQNQLFILVVIVVSLISHFLTALTQV